MAVRMLVALWTVWEVLWSRLQDLQTRQGAYVAHNQKSSAFSSTGSVCRRALACSSRTWQGFACCWKTCGTGPEPRHKRHSL